MSARTRPTRPGRRFLADGSGTTAVELAIVSPVFFAFLFGFFEFCWAQHCEASVRTALQQASRSLVLDPTLSQSALQSQVRSTLTTLADPNVTVVKTLQTTSYGQLATLTATYPQTLGVPMLATYHITYQTSVKAPLPTF